MRAVAPLRFGAFDVDVRAGELRKNGLRVKLQGQPFQLLVVLLQRPGEIVTREELQKELWPADTFVDFERGLNRAVNKLREVLDDDADNPRFIETLPRRGYRFLVPVEPVHPANPKVMPIPSPAAESKPILSLLGRQQRLLWSILGAAIVVGVGVWVSAKKPVRESGESGESGLIAVPLTTYPGHQMFPDFSPDGSQVVFDWAGPKNDNVDVYVKLNGTENLLRLTQDPAPDYAPAWSPDGRHIAFLRDFLNGHVAVMMVPSLGGPPERKLTEISSVVYSPKVGEALPGLSWSADSKWVAIQDRAPHEAQQSLYLVSVDSGERRRLTFPPSNCGDGTPAFSPDGRSLAFSRTLSFGVSEVFVLDLSEDLLPKQPPKQLTFSKQSTAGLAWTPDSREIVYALGASINGGSYDLWRVSRLGSGKPRVLSLAGDHGPWPAISHRGNRLAFAQFDTKGDENIWRLDLSRPGGASGEAVKLIASTRLDYVPQYSPDGKRIAFISQRTGRDEVWVCDSQGSGAVQLTSLSAAITGCPRWSADGARIVFDSNAVGTFDVYVVDSTGGLPKRLTNHSADDAVASWSRDGRLIYFVSNRTKTWQIWKMPADGGEAIQVTANGGYVAFESADGTTLYYAKGPAESTLWKMPAGGGEETQVLDTVYGICFAVLDKGIYFLRPSGGNNSPTLRFLSFKTGAVRSIASVRFPASFGLSVSPDGRHALYTQEDQQPGVHLMVVENFR